MTAKTIEMDKSILILINKPYMSLFIRLVKTIKILEEVIFLIKVASVNLLKQPKEKLICG